jgi:hypothetical protein
MEEILIHGFFIVQAYLIAWEINASFHTIITFHSADPLEQKLLKLEKTIPGGLTFVTRGEWLPAPAALK